jgi:ElaB/YqjD/DUF883 family membrane-anchored ribosome-binding protein
MGKSNIAEKGWRETAENLQEQARIWGDRAKERALYAGRATDHYVHDHAWSSVGIAVIAGLLLGVLLGRIRD